MVLSVFNRICGTARPITIQVSVMNSIQNKGRLLQRFLNFALNKIGAGAKFETFCIPKIFGFGIVGDTLLAIHCNIYCNIYCNIFPHN